MKFTRLLPLLFFLPATFTQAQQGASKPAQEAVTTRLAPFKTDVFDKFNPLPSETFYKVTVRPHHFDKVDFFGAQRESITKANLTEAMTKPNVDVDSDYFKALLAIREHWDAIAKLISDSTQTSITIADYKALVARDGNPLDLSEQDFNGLSGGMRKVRGTRKAIEPIHHDYRSSPEIIDWWLKQQQNSFWQAFDNLKNIPKDTIPVTPPPPVI
jgi:hypothetical protein